MKKEQLRKITMSSGNGTVREFMGGLHWRDALAICKNYDWEWMDENGFVWELAIEPDYEEVVKC